MRPTRQSLQAGEGQGGRRSTQRKTLEGLVFQRAEKNVNRDEKCRKTRESFQCQAKEFLLYLPDIL